MPYIHGVYIQKHLFLQGKEHEYGVKFAETEGIGLKTAICCRNIKAPLKTYTVTFFRLVGHEKYDCHAWQLIGEITYDVYKVQGQETPEGTMSEFPEQ